MNYNIIFDLDGTLIDSSVGIIEATNYALTRSGQPRRTDDEIKRFIGTPLEIMFAEFTDQPFERLSQLFQEKASESVVSSTVVLESVESVLIELQGQGYTMALATTKIKKHVDLILEKCSWHSVFAATVGGDEVENQKPAPDSFLLAMKRLNCDPALSIVVGDTENDVYAAQRASLKVITIDSDCGSPEATALSSPDYHLKTIAELPDKLKEIFSGGC